MMLSPGLSPSLTDCLRQIEENCPQWIARLDDLTQQILRRHSELRELSVRQLKKKTGSTESLIPRPNEADGDGPPANVTVEPAPIMPNHYHHHHQQHLGRRKRKTETISSSMEPSKFRTRSMIIVYYDSAVQEAFESLVRNISSARNNIRKGRMALKMKQITAMSMDDDDGDDDGVAPWMQSDDANGAAPIINPRMLFARTPRSRSGGAAAGRMFGVAGIGGRGGDGSDKSNTPIDTMDQLLESAQSLSEHGAHQFLRDGDCSVEIAGIKSRLAEVTEIAKREIPKLQAEEADGAGSEGDGEPIETDGEPRPPA